PARGAVKTDARTTKSDLEPEHFERRPNPRDAGVEERQAVSLRAREIEPSAGSHRRFVRETDEGSATRVSILRRFHAAPRPSRSRYSVSRRRTAASRNAWMCPAPGTIHMSFGSAARSNSFREWWGGTTASRSPWMSSRGIGLIAPTAATGE